MGDAHALAATAGGGLYHDRKADALGDLYRFVFGFDDAHVARHGGHACGLRRLLRFNLVAHGIDGCGIGADKDDASLAEGFGKGRAFGQEAVAGMHRFRAGCLAGRNNFFNHKIGLGGGGRANVHLFISHFHVQRARIGVGIDRNGGNSHPAGGLDHAASNLAAIGNQNLLEHETPRNDFFRL